MTDCGVFILEYMERFIEDPDALLAGVPDEIDKLNWFPKDLVESKRLHMAEFLIGMNRGQQIEVNHISSSINDHLEAVLTPFSLILVNFF